MNNKDYQEMRAISSHWLIEMLDSPAACYRKYLDPQRPREQPTDAMRLGSSVHCLALTPLQFGAEFILEMIDRRTKAGKARYSALTSTGLTVVSPGEFAQAQAIVAALKADPEACALLAGGEKEKIIIQVRDQGLLPLKARLDLYHESRRQAIELKTIRNLNAIEAAMRRYRYPLSAAFYQEMSRCRSVVIIFVENREPFQVAIREMEPAQLEEGRNQWQTALARFDDCWRRNEWPEAEPAAPDDDPLMIPIIPVPALRRIEIPVGELAL